MSSVTQLQQKYSQHLDQLQAIFPDWDEQDLLFTLQDAKGNLEDAVVMITEGRAHQFTTASTKRKAPKAKQSSTNGGWSEAAESGFGSGFESKGTRGGRGGRGGGRGGRGGDRGGRGGRGGSRGGRGGLTRSSEPSNSWADEPAATTSAWGAAPAAAVPAAGAGAGGWGDEPASTQDDSPNTQGSDPEPAPAVQSKAEDFASAGGWGDAPAPKEVEKAAASGWSQKEAPQVAKSSVPPAPAVKAKLTWAQIAKPAEKPKPVPPPAPVAPEPEAEPMTSDEPVAQSSTEVPPEVLEETPAEPDNAWGDAPSQEELEAEAEAVLESTKETSAETEQPDDLLPEEPVTHSETQGGNWEEDPAIAGSGTQLDWAEESTPAQEPEPAQTYQGPPGFSSVAAKAAPGVQAQSAPRSNSRAAQRYKDAEGQGVVLPSKAGALGGMEMQFGSLSFGGQNGDGVDSPVPEPKQQIAAQPEAAPVAAPAPPQAQAPPQSQPVTSPLAQTQPPQSAPQQPAPQAQLYQNPQQAYNGPAPHLALQQQMQNYQYLQQQQALAAQPDHSGHQGQQFYRGEFYSPAEQAQAPAQQQGQAQAQPQAQQPQQQPQAQAPAQAPQPSNSPYEPFGAFGQQSRLVGQQAQAQAADPYGAAHRSYDSYNASAYRPPVEEPKSTATPTAPGQLPHQGSGYYSGMGNMAYYQQGPYNPYYQYGQAPQAGFGQYYPVAGRNVYGQHAPQQPPAPIPSKQPQSTPSPYGAPPTYPAFNNTEESFSGLGRYDAKPAQAQQAQPQQQQAQQQGQGYGQQGLQGFLGVNSQNSGARSQNAPEDFKVSSGSQQPSQNPTPATSANAVSVGGAPGAQAQRAPQVPQQQQQQQQGFGSYPYGGGAAAYGGEGWGGYGHYGRNYHWQQ